MEELGSIRPGKYIPSGGACGILGMNWKNILITVIGPLGVQEPTAEGGKKIAGKQSFLKLTLKQTSASLRLLT